MSQYPIFITCRDRLSPLLKLLAWLEWAGHRRIYLVDNASTYPPLLDFYRATSHRVIPLDTNLGKCSAWQSGVIDDVAADEFYVVTDPDVVPSADCPPDALTHFRTLLDRYPDRIKVGFGLKIDDLPPHYRYAAEVVALERRYWETEVEPGVYDAPIDTTFALYRPGSGFELSPSLRTGPPYVARHLPWHVASDRLSREDRHYHEHARSTTWVKPHLDPRTYDLLREESVHEISDDDRCSLAALRQVLGERGQFRCLQIGAFHAELTQSLLDDSRCLEVVVFDPNDGSAVDKDDQSQRPHGLTTGHILERLAQATAGAERQKLKGITGSVAELNARELNADLCFVDAVSTVRLALHCARFCRTVLRDRGLIVFTNRTAITPGVVAFLRELPRTHNAYPLRNDLLVVEIGIPSLRTDRRIRTQVPRTFWLVASHLRLMPLALRVGEFIHRRRRPEARK